MNDRNVKDHGECLSDETVTDYLEGNLDPVVQAACESHLIVCDNCRENLAAFMRLMQPLVTSEEEVAVGEIAQAWDRRFKKAVPVPAPTRNKRTFWYGAAAAALILLILGPVWKAVRPPNSTPTPHELIQAILIRDRPFESQLADEPHRPRVRSSAGGSGIDFDSLSNEMSRQAASQYEIGRIRLIRKQFSEAIVAFKNASGDPNATAAVHNDLGVAYMEQGLSENGAKAEQEFLSALKLNPRFAPAVFNLALFYDLAMRPEEAKQQRSRYLELDSTSGWADEVRLKLITP